uniref:Uncharacterized protein n=1 Tax=Manihot esculenta TaxID=3983 RepID=A0A2C9WM01_MANES
MVVQLSFPDQTTSLSYSQIENNHINYSLEGRRCIPSTKTYGNHVKINTHRTSCQTLHPGCLM